MVDVPDSESVVDWAADGWLAIIGMVIVAVIVGGTYIVVRDYNVTARLIEFGVVVGVTTAGLVAATAVAVVLGYLLHTIPDKTRRWLGR